MKSFHNYPELASYQSEPKQLPSGAPGKNALLKLGFERRGDRTALTSLERHAPLLVQQALYFDEEMPNLPCVIMISTAGGVLQGDRYAIEMHLASDTQAHVTTQSATKIQEMDANYAAQTQEICLGENAYLEYLPAPTIPYKNSRFLTHTKITLPTSATVLYSEILMPGRKYYGSGESFQYNLYSSHVQAARPDGTPVFTEKFIIVPQRDDVRQTGIMGNFDVLANVVLLTPKEHADRVFADALVQMNLDGGCASGASRLPNDGGLLFKVLGTNRETVQALVREIWSSVRQHVLGTKVPGEFPWR
jgi:urease accessory protein